MMASEVPKRQKLTLEELRSQIEAAKKAATTFEKTPTFEMTEGLEIQFRVDDIREGEEIDIVLSKDVRVLTDGKFVSKPLTCVLRDYDENLQPLGPAKYVERKRGEDIRIQNRVVKAFAEKGVELHKGYVYWAAFLGTVTTSRGRTFKQMAVLAIGTDFAD